MKLPRGIVQVELRAKLGRRHVLVWGGFFQEDLGWSVRFAAGREPRGAVRWYGRRRGERWKALSDWFTYYPEVRA